MGLFHTLRLSLRDRRRSARRRRRTALGVERLDERIALAVDQLWVRPGSPMSTDDPTGAATNPFHSLEEAQATIRARLAAGPQRRDIVVNIAGGTYDLDGPLTFTAADSGKNGHTVTWRAAPGATPVFSGSRQVTGWQPVASPQLLGLGLNTVWKADVSGLSLPGALQLYVDGVRGTLAETNASAMPGDANPTYPFGFRPLIGQYGWLLDPGAPGPNGIVYSDPGLLAPGNTNPLDWRDPTTWDRVEGVANPLRQQDVTAVGRMQWREFRMPVQSIGAFNPLQILDMPSLFDDLPVGLITMQADPWRAASLGVAPASTAPGAPPQQPLVPAVWNPWRITQFVGSYQFLDRPGEWYYDRVGKNVYIVCPSSADPNSQRIEIPVAESLLEVRGTATSPVRNLAVQGLTFSGATWLDPAIGAGYVPDQTGVMIDAGKNPVTGDWLNDFTTTGHSQFTKATPGNVKVAYARNVAFIGNTFANLGGVGLQLGTGSQGVRVSRNTFTGISSSAITVGGASWCRVDPSIDPLAPQSKWVIDPARRITVLGTDAFPGDSRAVVRDVAIQQNTITSTGVDYVDAAGIFVGFARNTRIENNVIDDSAWSGMQIGWGWGLVDSPRFTGQPNSAVNSWLPYDLGVPTALGGTRVIGNVITNFCTQVYDGGAVYMTGAQGRGWGDATLVRGNDMHSKRPLAGCNIVYTDGGTRWVTVADNLQYDNPQGVFWMGADFSLADGLNSPLASLFALLSGSTNDLYSFFPVVNGSPYGSEIGGCIPAGDFRYVNNLWENRWAGSQFPFPLYQPSLPRYPNLSNWPNNPLFYNPTPLLSYYSLTKGLTFAGNKFLVYDAHGPNPAISAWLARRGAGTRWKPGAG